jgi:hypothetical protein
MKKVLSFLLSIVFLHAQTAPLFAHRGGPENSDNNTANVDIVGTYSGTLIPDDPIGSGTPNQDASETLNSLGLFNLGVPSSGPASGSFLIFTQGFIFTGTITAVGDPGKGTINGIVEGSFDFLDFVRDAAGNPIIDAMGQPVTATFTAVVRGTLEADVLQDASFDPTNLATQFNTFQRIAGRAEMGVILPGGTTNKILRYTVDGVKQSTTAVTTALGGTGTGN